jgi:hypothetical protein
MAIIEESILGKILDIALNSLMSFMVDVVKICSPVKITPRKVLKNKNADWKNITTIKIENILNNELYDVTVIGISKNKFEIKIISDNTPKGKTVEHMNINTNHIVVYGQDQKTKNYWWIFKINKLNPKEKILLNVKIDNPEDIFFDLSRYSRIEIPIKERDDGVVSIPFQIGKMPKLK